MIFADTKTFQLGPYTVSRCHEADLYRIFLGSILIGKCYSRPCMSDCEWIERQQREQTFYAYSSTPLPELTGKRRLNTGGLAPAMARWEGHVARKRTG